MRTLTSECNHPSAHRTKGARKGGHCKVDNIPLDYSSYLHPQEQFPVKVGEIRLGVDWEPVDSNDVWVNAFEGGQVVDDGRAPIGTPQPPALNAPVVSNPGGLKRKLLMLTSRGRKTTAAAAEPQK